jgi:hypothetical protein
MYLCGKRKPGTERYRVASTIRKMRKNHLKKTIFSSDDIPRRHCFKRAATFELQKRSLLAICTN